MEVADAAGTMGSSAGAAATDINDSALDMQNGPPTAATTPMGSQPDGAARAVAGEPDRQVSSDPSTHAHHRKHGSYVHLQQLAVQCTVLISSWLGLAALQPTTNSMFVLVAVALTRLQLGWLLFCIIWILCSESRNNTAVTAKSGKGTPTTLWSACGAVQRRLAALCWDVLPLRFWRCAFYLALLLLSFWAASVVREEQQQHELHLAQQRSGFAPAALAPLPGWRGGPLPPLLLNTASPPGVRIVAAGVARSRGAAEAFAAAIRSAAEARMRDSLRLLRVAGSWLGAQLLQPLLLLFESNGTCSAADAPGAIRAQQAHRSATDDDSAARSGSWASAWLGWGVGRLWDLAGGVLPPLPAAARELLCGGESSITHDSSTSATPEEPEEDYGAARGVLASGLYCMSLLLLLVHSLSSELGRLLLLLLSRAAELLGVAGFAASSHGSLGGSHTVDWLVMAGISAAVACFVASTCLALIALLAAAARAAVSCCCCALRALAALLGCGKGAGRDGAVALSSWDSCPGEECRQRSSAGVAFMEIVAAAFTCGVLLLSDRNFVLFLWRSMYSMRLSLLSLLLLLRLPSAQVHALLDWPPPVEGAALLLQRSQPLRVMDPHAVGAMVGCLLAAVLLRTLRSATGQPDKHRPYAAERPAAAAVPSPSTLAVATDAAVHADTATDGSAMSWVCTRGNRRPSRSGDSRQQQQQQQQQHSRREQDGMTKSFSDCQEGMSDAANNASRDTPGAEEAALGPETKGMDDQEPQNVEEAESACSSPALAGDDGSLALDAPSESVVGEAQEPQLPLSRDQSEKCSDHRQQALQRGLEHSLQQEQELAKTVAALRRDTQDMQRTNETLKEKLQQKEQKLHQIQQELQQNKDLLRESEKQVSEIAAERDALSSYKSEVQVLTERLAENQKKQQQLQQQLEESESRHQEQQQQLQQQLAESESRHQEMQQHLKKQLAESESRHTEVQLSELRLRHAACASEEELLKLRAKYDEVVARANESRAQVDELTKEADALKQQLTALRGEQQQQQQQLEEQRQQHLTLRSAADEEKLQLQQRLEQVTAYCDQAKRLAHEAESAQVRLNKELEHARAELKGREAQWSQRLQSLESSSLEQQRLSQQRGDELQEQLRVAQNQLADAEQERSGLVQLVATLAESLDDTAKREDALRELRQVEQKTGMERVEKLKQVERQLLEQLASSAALPAAAGKTAEELKAFRSCSQCSAHHAHHHKEVRQQGGLDDLSQLLSTARRLQRHAEGDEKKAEDMKRELEGAQTLPTVGRRGSVSTPNRLSPVLGDSNAESVSPKEARSLAEALQRNNGCVYSVTRQLQQIEIPRAVFDSAAAVCCETLEGNQANPEALRAWGLSESEQVVAASAVNTVMAAMPQASEGSGDLNGSSPQQELEKMRGILRMISKLFPSSSSVQRIRLLANESQKLSPAEQKLVPLVEVPKCEARLKLLIIVCDLEPQWREQRLLLRRGREALENVQLSRALRSLLRACAEAGAAPLSALQRGAAAEDANASSVQLPSDWAKAGSEVSLLQGILEQASAGPEDRDGGGTGLLRRVVQRAAALHGGHEHDGEEQRRRLFVEQLVQELRALLELCESAKSEVSLFAQSTLRLQEWREGWAFSREPGLASNSSSKASRSGGGSSPVPPGYDMPPAADQESNEVMGNIKLCSAITSVYVYALLKLQMELVQFGRRVRSELRKQLPPLGDQQHSSGQGEGSTDSALLGARYWPSTPAAASATPLQLVAGSPSGNMTPGRACGDSKGRAPSEGQRELEEIGIFMGVLGKTVAAVAQTLRTANDQGQAAARKITGPRHEAAEQDVQAVVTQKVAHAAVVAAAAAQSMTKALKTWRSARAPTRTQSSSTSVKAQQQSGIPPPTVLSARPESTVTLRASKVGTKRSLRGPSAVQPSRSVIEQQRRTQTSDTLNLSLDRARRVGAAYSTHQSSRIEQHQQHRPHSRSQREAHSVQPPALGGPQKAATAPQLSGYVSAPAIQKGMCGPNGPVGPGAVGGDLGDAGLNAAEMLTTAIPRAPRSFPLVDSPEEGALRPALGQMDGLAGLGFASSGSVGQSSSSLSVGLGLNAEPEGPQRQLVARRSSETLPAALPPTTGSDSADQAPVFAASASARYVPSQAAFDGAAVTGKVTADSTARSGDSSGSDGELMPIEQRGDAFPGSR